MLSDCQCVDELIRKHGQEVFHRTGLNLTTLILIFDILYLSEKHCLVHTQTHINTMFIYLGLFIYSV